MKLCYLVIGFLLVGSQAWGYSDKELAYCVIGEATGEGLVGMTAVTFVYKNRLASGMKLGCEAITRPDIKQFVKREGKKRMEQALDIIAKVNANAIPDITFGANHYLRSDMKKKPRWVDSMTVTTVIGNHTFYKGK